MEYFFCLGTNLSLSLAEIYQKLNVSGKLIQNVYIAETKKEINASKLIRHLGGTIKIGKIESTLENIKKDQIIKEIIGLLNPQEKKYKFGFSFYGKSDFNEKVVAMEIKKYLKEKGVSCRWVVSREKILSSVVVEQNKLTGDNGIEIVFIKNKNKLLIGKTLAVQPFKELSKRDYGRPKRDDYAGMLPPKLAQIMINLASPDLKNKTLLDPFCGSGTILNEAALLGCSNLIGADISEKAINDSKENFKWLKGGSEGLSGINPEFMNISATEISQKIKKNSVDLIVTEPFLGEQRGRIDFKKETKKLEKLYSSSFKEFKKILKKEGSVVIIFPVFINKFKINPDLNGFKIINPLPEFLRKEKNVKLTARDTIIYGRPGQKVWREIVILKK